jgi:hypothetical protein
MQATLRQTERQLIRLQVGFIVLLHGWNQLELYSNPHHRGRLSWKKLELMRESSRCGTATAAAASACPTSLPPLLLTLSRQLEAEVDSLRAQVRCDPPPNALPFRLFAGSRSHLVFEQLRELKRERAQLLSVRGGEAGEAGVQGGRGAGVLHARNQGVDGDMSLQDMFTGLQRSVLLLLLLPPPPPSSPSLLFTG